MSDYYRYDPIKKTHDTLRLNLKRTLKNTTKKALHIKHRPYVKKTLLLERYNVGPTKNYERKTAAERYNAKFVKNHHT